MFRSRAALLRPLHQGVARGRLEAAEEDVARVASAKRGERSLRGESERSLDAERTQRGDDDGGETEGHALGHGERGAAVKRDVVIDVHDVALAKIDENVVEVSIAEAEEMTQHGRRRHGTRVRGHLTQPRRAGGRAAPQLAAGSSPRNFVPRDSHSPLGAPAQAALALALAAALIADASRSAAETRW